MPGGRGTLLDIAASLNDSDSVDETVTAIKSAIDHGDYRISNTSAVIIAASFSACSLPVKLHEVWCYALDKRAVDWSY